MPPIIECLVLASNRRFCLAAGDYDSIAAISGPQRARSGELDSVPIRVTTAIQRSLAKHRSRPGIEPSYRVVDLYAQLSTEPKEMGIPPGAFELR